MKRWIYRYADAILGASEATLELIWGPNWRQDSRFVFQPNGIDISEFEQPVDPVEIRRELGIPSDSRIVLTVGRYVPHKKHILIPEIAKRLCKNHPNLYFVIAGSGPLYGQVEERIRQLGLEERFRLLRGLPSLIGLWKSSDAFLFPSTQEGFGIVVIEAAAGGLPIVARRIPGVTEAASACKNAILLEDKATVEQWADAVTKALAIGRTQINDYKGFAKDFKFTSQKSFDVLSGVYERIMQNNRVGGTK
jgi:glycosyltransferase involved in cell wall biosynthesis